MAQTVGLCALSGPHMSPIGRSSNDPGERRACRRRRHGDGPPAAPRSRRDARRRAADGDGPGPSLLRRPGVQMVQPRRRPAPRDAAQFLRRVRRRVHGPRRGGDRRGHGGRRAVGASGRRAAQMSSRSTSSASRRSSGPMRRACSRSPRSSRRTRRRSRTTTCSSSAWCPSGRARASEPASWRRA
jgi:hypothetical protein